jgi:hypothetical protein
MPTLQRSRGFSRPNPGGPRNHTENRDAFLRIPLYPSSHSQKVAALGLRAVVASSHSGWFTSAPQDPEFGTPLCKQAKLPAPTEGRRYDSTMNLRKEKPHRGSFHA